MSNEGISAVLEGLVVDGDMVHGKIDANGEQTYRLTEQGKKKVEAMIAAKAAEPNGVAPKDGET